MNSSDQADRRKTPPQARKAARRSGWVLGLGAVLALCVAVLVVILIGVQQGLFDTAIQKTLSAKTGRSVAFTKMRARLFSLTPVFTIDNLVIGSPPAISPARLLWAPQAVLKFSMGAWLSGNSHVLDVTLDHPVAHLIRLGPGRSNYSGSGGGSPGWQRLARLEVTDGRLLYEDPQRHATLQANVTHRAASGGPRPLTLSGGGVINGAPFRVEARGASLAGQNSQDPYPFEAVLDDGDFRAQVSGTSGKPFDFRQLDLRLAASGPNLADFTYLFGAVAPNTPPFHLSAHLTRSEPALSLTDIVGAIGETDLTGALSTDRKPGSRRIIQSSLTAKRLYLGDLRAMLRSRPGHLEARSRSGAPPRRSPSGPLLSDAPFNLAALRRTDLRIRLQAAQTPDAPFTVSRLDAALTLTAGRLSLSPLSFSTAPGQFHGQVLLDGSRDVPLVAIRGSLSGAQLASLEPGLGSVADGMLELDADLQGDGRSLRAAAARVRGRLAVRLSRGRLQKAKAAALGGDLVQAMGLSLGDKRAQTPLSCAVADLAGSHGRLEIQALDVVTDVGWTRGSGDIDLGAQTLDLVLQGSPAHPRPFQVDAPVRITGPLQRPNVKVDPIKILERVAASLPSGPKAAPAPTCAELLSRSSKAGRYTG